MKQRFKDRSPRFKDHSPRLCEERYLHHGSECGGSSGVDFDTR